MRPSATAWPPRPSWKRCASSPASSPKGKKNAWRSVLVEMLAVLIKRNADCHASMPQRTIPVC